MNIYIDESGSFVNAPVMGKWNAVAALAVPETERKKLEHLVHRLKTSTFGASASEVKLQELAAGLYVFFPLLDAGFDLVVTNRRGASFIPVQVKFREREPALGLLPKDRSNFEGTNVVLAWLIGSGEKGRKWYVPFDDWCSKAVAPPGRKDGLAYITISENEDWLFQFEGNAGIQRTFGRLLK